MAQERTAPYVQVGAICWIASVIFFVAQALAQTVFSPAYSLVDDRVSDLGNTTCGAWLTHAFACSPLHGLVDAAFVVTGVLLVVGAVLTWPAWPSRNLTRFGLTSIALAGSGYVLVGFYPEDVNMRLHILGASNLFFSNLGLLLLGLATWQERTWRAVLALGGACLGFVGLLLGPLLLIEVGHGGGLAERLVLYPLVVFAVVIGASLLHRGRRNDEVLRTVSSAAAVASGSDPATLQLYEPGGGDRGAAA